MQYGTKRTEDGFGFTTALQSSHCRGYRERVFGSKEMTKKTVGF